MLQSGGQPRASEAVLVAVARVVGEDARAVISSRLHKCDPVTCQNVPFAPFLFKPSFSTAPSNEQELVVALSLITKSALNQDRLQKTGPSSPFSAEIVSLLRPWV